MKKTVLILWAAIILFCFTGCKKTAENPPQLSSVSFTAQVTSGKNEYTVNTVLSEDGTVKGTVTAPETLKGAVFTAKDDEVTLEFHGIAYTKKIDDYPVTSVITSLCGIINDAKNGNLEGSGADNRRISGKCKGLEYEFWFTPSGLPLKLSVPETDTVIVFSDTAITEK